MLLLRAQSIKAYLAIKGNYNYFNFNILQLQNTSLHPFKEYYRGQVFPVIWTQTCLMKSFCSQLIPHSCQIAIIWVAIPTMESVTKHI